MVTGWNTKHTLSAIAMLLVFALVIVFYLNLDDGDTPDATPTPSPTITTPAATATPSEDAFVVAPGRVGAAEAGMTKSDAAATGLFDTDVDHGTDDCRGVAALEWKPSVSTSLDVLTEADGRIAAMGISAGGPKTAEGIGVGSTFGELTAAYPSLSPVTSEGFDQSGAFINDGDAWLGFLFDERPDAVDDSSKITFMEVDDRKPLLIRDGC